MWFVQSTNINQTNGDRLMTVLQHHQIPFKDVGVIPFSTEITGMGVESYDSVFFYGSTKLIRLAMELKMGGVYFDYSTFNVMAWREHFNSDVMLNVPKIQQVSNLLELEASGKYSDIGTEMFVRPVVDLKMFNGTVKPVCETWSYFFNNVFNGNINKHTLITRSPVKDIFAEWRIFFVNGKIITGSMYRKNGVLLPNDNTPIPKIVLEKAQQWADHWLPNPNCVMDIAKINKGYRIIEFNCINASGFYGSDIEKFVCAIEDLK